MDLVTQKLSMYLVYCLPNQKTFHETKNSHCVLLLSHIDAANFINGSPPSTYSIKEGEKAVIPCNAIGNPNNISYIWKKGDADVTSIGTNFTNNNGTLEIQDIRYSHSGMYSCIISNGIEPVSRQMNITVTVRCKFTWAFSHRLCTVRYVEYMDGVSLQHSTKTHH